MESNKVKLPKEVTTALDEICANPINPTIYSKLVAYESHWKEQFPRMMMDDILKALVNGYEVEETPEEQIRKIFKQYDGGLENTIAWEHQQDIIKILNLLNIKIKGVNDHEE